ncbi:ferric uptake regulation protein [gut metagenome]|uniref:Ferric uptake regulation protein n=1 Tax=gut metagenome TaxID=749906 RepID=J9BU67_9ZZZZ
MMENLEHLLLEKDIKPTAIRLLVVRAMQEADCALSLTNLETRLATVDKSTIFRTLTLFLEHHIIHAVSDGSGQTKYALCPSDCHCDNKDGHNLNGLHIHFSCENCHRTFCLRGLSIPEVELPEGFVLNNANYVLMGLCPECAAKQKKR